MPTLTKTTDTPRAARARKVPTPSTAVTETTTKPTAAKVSPTVAAKRVVDSSKFVELFKSDAKSLLEKIRLVGLPSVNGAEIETVRNVLTSALDDAKVDYDKKSFSSAVSHYITAYTLANAHKFANHDLALGAVYKLSHGAVPIKALTAWCEKFSGTADEWITGLAMFAKETKAAKPAVGAKAPKESAETAESVPVVIPLSFNDILTELDLRLKTADPKDRAIMVSALARVVAKTNPIKVAA